MWARSFSILCLHKNNWSITYSFDCRLWSPEWIQHRDRLAGVCPVLSTHACYFPPQPGITDRVISRVQEPHPSRGISFVFEKLFILVRRTLLLYVDQGASYAFLSNKQMVVLSFVQMLRENGTEHLILRKRNAVAPGWIWYFLGMSTCFTNLTKILTSECRRPRWLGRCSACLLVVISILWVRVLPRAHS